jgi:hypothetical protein
LGWDLVPRGGFEPSHQSYSHSIARAQSAAATLKLQGHPNEETVSPVHNSVGKLQFIYDELAADDDKPPSASSSAFATATRRE